MGKKVKICKINEFPEDGMLGVEINGTPPLAVYKVDGEFYATSNICTHNYALLTDGFLEGDVIECPLHGGCFNVKSGEPLEFPCETPLRTYPVHIDGDEIYVNVVENNAVDEL